MAEFSTQYCKIKDMGFDGDFDVYEEWSKLEPNSAIPYICEGFGFMGIGKEEGNDKVWVYLENKWVDFDDLVIDTKPKISLNDW